MTDLATLVVKLEAQSAAYQKGLDEAKQQLKGFQQSVESTFDKLKETAIEFLSADALYEFGKGIIEADAQLGKLAAQTGIAVDELSRLQFAAKQNDVSNFSGDMLKLSKSVGEANNGNQQLILDFKAIGISANDLKSLSLDQILKKAADGFTGFADGAGKSAAEVRLFGRAGQDLSAFLNQGASGIEAYEKQLDQLGGVTTEQAAENAHKFEQAMNELNVAVQGTGREFLEALLPAVNESIKAIAEFFAQTRNVGETNGLTVAVQGIATAVLTLIYSFESVGNLIKESFEGIYKQLTTFAAAAVAVTAGQYKDAYTILKAGNAEQAADTDKSHKDQLARDEAYSAALSKIWYKTADDQAAAAKQGSTAQQGFYDAEEKALGGGKPDLLIDNAEAIKSLEASIKSVQAKTNDIDLSTGLKATNEAAARAAVSVGTLAEKVKQAGSRGADLAASYIAANRALDFKQAEESLDKLDRAAKEQVATFGLSKLATEAYKLSTGEAGAAVARLGDQGKKAANDILSNFRELEKLDLQNFFIGVDAELGALQNKTADTAAAVFALKNASKLQEVGDTGDAAGAAKLAHLQASTVATAQYNDLQAQRNVILSTQANLEADIAAQVAANQTTTIDGQAKIDAARKDEVKQLTDNQAALDALGTQYGTDLPASVALGVASSKSALKTLSAQTDELGTKLRTDFTDDASNAFSDFVTGAKSAGDAFKEFLDNIAQELTKLASKNLFESLFQDNSGSGGSNYGAIFTKLAGAFAGSFGGGANLSGAASAAIGSGASNALDNLNFAPRASGGPVNKGGSYLVGEDGPERFMPGQSGTIIPNHMLSGMSVVQHITIEAPAGTVSKQTQLQAGASVARGLALAQKRNG